MQEIRHFLIFATMSSVRLNYYPLPHVHLRALFPKQTFAMLSCLKVESGVMSLQSCVYVLPIFAKKHDFYESRYESYSIRRYLTAVCLNVIKLLITTRMPEFVDWSDVRNNLVRWKDIRQYILEKYPHY